MKLDARHILKTHLATERTTSLREANNEYVFEVDKKANKYHIRQAVEEAFKVKVESVNTMIVPGKKRRIRREEGKTSTWKKAVVRLKKGESITAFDNI
jgi:large subunit ribosomal protein L23